jgi:hypothetical protein
MQQKNISSSEPTIQEVREKLELWRKNKKNVREPIPENLWQEAVELCKKHPAGIIAKKLSLSYTRLKDRLCGQAPKASDKDACPDFIELKYNQPDIPSDTTLEIKDLKRDLRLKISFKGRPDFDLTSLIKTFCQ